jgi:DNA-binding IclR family transcriptional regulator
MLEKIKIHKSRFLQVTEFLVEYEFVETDESKKRIRLSKEAKALMAIA